MSRRARRRSSREEGNVAGWIYGIIGTIIIVSIVGAAAYLNLGKRETSRATGCPTDHYDGITVVLIDLTDRIRPTQGAALHNALQKIRNDVPRFGRLEIYPLKSTATKTIEPLFAGCSPGSGRDVDNRWYGNPELADRLWKKQFAEKIDAVVADLQNIPEEANSPVLEGIQSVAVTALGAPLAEKATDRRLVIISDMIHNTPELKMYGGVPSFDRFKTTQYFARIKPQLRQAKVDIFLLVRETHRNVQQPPLYNFWLNYVASADGYLRNWEPLQ